MPIVRRKVKKPRADLDFPALAGRIREWGGELGFQQVGITDIDLESYRRHLESWLEQRHHGEMSYMARHHNKRCHPDKLHPGAARIISVRMDYDHVGENSLGPMAEGDTAYVARYARGRDYHKMMRMRLQRLADRIEQEVGSHSYRAFVDSAPVLERAIAEKAGLGWIGKNTMLINPEAGSWFFLGELFTDLPLPVDEPGGAHCGTCRACLDICPTGAFTGPNSLDARKCISYLTIELRGPIPEELREPMGNRIFGCDDCQIVCPWNKFARISAEADFAPRHQLDSAGLCDLFAWSEEEFKERTAGSAIRRIGYECWLRNIAVALGNAPASEETVSALRARLGHPSELVAEHVRWALARQQEKSSRLTLSSR